MVVLSCNILYVIPGQLNERLAARVIWEGRPVCATVVYNCELRSDCGRDCIAIYSIGPL